MIRYGRIYTTLQTQVTLDVPHVYDKKRMCIWKFTTLVSRCGTAKYAHENIDPVSCKLKNVLKIPNILVV